MSNTRILKTNQNVFPLFKFSHRSKTMQGSIIFVFAVSSFIIHLVSAGQIAYQEWKYQKEHTAIHVIQLPPHPCQNASVLDRNDDRIHRAPQANTTRYNPILFQLENIICLAIMLGICIVIIILQQFSSNHASDYAKQFTPGLMINVVMPCIFYARNAKARKFVVSCFGCR